jgi:hypothetical protein
MVKINWSGLAVLTAVALGGALGLTTAPVAKAQDARAPMVRMGEQRPDNRQRGAVMVRIAEARGGAKQRQNTGAQRASAMQRRDEKKPAQLTRDAPPRARAVEAPGASARGVVERAGNAPRRSR